MRPSRFGRPLGNEKVHIFRPGENRALCGKLFGKVIWLDETEPRRTTCERCCWALDGRYVVPHA